MNEDMRTGNLPANMKKARVIQIIPCKAALGPPRGIETPRQDGIGAGTLGEFFDCPPL